MSDTITISQEAIEQLKAVGQDGRTNMFDRTAALAIASEYGFYELIEWASEHPKAWGPLILGQIEVA